MHVGLDDLPGLGVHQAASDGLRALLADLPLVPDAASSAQLVGPGSVTLPCLAVLARHVGQGLRDQNLTIAHDRGRLGAERRKLLFLSAATLEEAAARGDQRPDHESVVFVFGAGSAVTPLLARRQVAGLASFVTTTGPIRELGFLVASG